VPLKPIRNLLHQRIRAGLTTTRRPEPTSTGGDVVAVLCQARSASSATYSAHARQGPLCPQLQMYCGLAANDVTGQIQTFKN
jgi:hypothetical protein